LHTWVNAESTAAHPGSTSIIDAILIALLSGVESNWKPGPTPRSARRRRSARSKTLRPVYGGYARAVTVFKRR